VTDFFRVDWAVDHLDDVWLAFQEHLWLTFLAVAIGFAISFPIAIIAHRRRWVYGTSIAAAGILYTIPSLALLAALVPFTGLSTLTAEIALVGYTLLILIRNIVTGLNEVPRDTIEAAEGMGFSRRQLLWRVQIPLALPAIVAGLRIATVTTIGLVTVTALIGKGGLGSLIYLGLIRTFSTAIVLGAGLSLILAIAADFLLIRLERVMSPWARRRGGAPA
jgi:osmoprotectant transport system permease protein